MASAAGSETPTPEAKLQIQLPIIDLSREELKPGTQCWDLACSEVRRALEEYGCFEALFDHKVSFDLYNDFYAAVDKLFDLPSQTKQSFVGHDRPYVGYRGSKPGNPYYESIGIWIDDPSNFQPIQDLTSLMWPPQAQEDHHHPHPDELFCRMKLQSYGATMSELSKMITRMALQSLGVEKYFDSHVESTGYALRVTKYNVSKTKTEDNDEDEAKLGLNSHADNGFLTILNSNHNGLEVLTKDEQWIKVTPPSPSSFIVMIGQSFQAWSNGRFCSPTHRVMLSGKKDRYAVVLFSHMKGLIQCPEELVDEQHTLLYKPFYDADLLRFVCQFHAREGFYDDTLEAFAGL